MKCPICNNELLEGGIIVQHVAPGWVPMEQFKKKGVMRLMYTDMRTIGESSILLNQTKIPNAYFCKNCNKVMGIFDVTNNLDNQANSN